MHSISALSLPCSTMARILKNCVCAGSLQPLYKSSRSPLCCLPFVTVLTLDVSKKISSSRRRRRRDTSPPQRRCTAETDASANDSALRSSLTFTLRAHHVSFHQPLHQPGVLDSLLCIRLLSNVGFSSSVNFQSLAVMSGKWGITPDS
jgi:hypothetical protein